MNETDFVVLELRNFQKKLIFNKEWSQKIVPKKVTRGLFYKS